MSWTRLNEKRPAEGAPVLLYSDDFGLYDRVGQWRLPRPRRPSTGARMLAVVQAPGRLQQRRKVLTHPALLVVDENGYLPVSRTGALHFFQLMTRRYEAASTVPTSNKGFKDTAVAGFPKRGP